MTQEQKDVLQPSNFFATTVYTLVKKDFLEGVSKASNLALEAAKKQVKQNEIYPSVMSGSMIGMPDAQPLVDFILNSAPAVLSSQGYATEKYQFAVTEFWCQEHYKMSNMEQHVHASGSVLSGFYFIETPENGCMIRLHDPRAGKVQAALDAKASTEISEASESIHIKPEEGMVVITNSWLPHSFTRNESDKPCKFIHFNVAAIDTRFLPSSGATIV